MKGHKNVDLDQRSRSGLQVDQISRQGRGAKLSHVIGWVDVPFSVSQALSWEPPPPPPSRNRWDGRKDRLIGISKERSHRSSFITANDRAEQAAGNPVS